MVANFYMGSIPMATPKLHLLYSEIEKKKYSVKILTLDTGGPGQNG